MLGEHEGLGSIGKKRGGCMLTLGREGGGIYTQYYSDILKITQGNDTKMKEK